MAHPVIPLAPVMVSGTYFLRCFKEKFTKNQGVIASCDTQISHSVRATRSSNSKLGTTRFSEVQNQRTIPFVQRKGCLYFQPALRG